jgi:transcriptional regulator with XRE-family HTH domain
MLVSLSTRKYPHAQGGVVFHTGDVILKWRKQRGWSNAVLATHAKVDKNTVTRAENGENTGIDTLERITTALGHTLAELHTALTPTGLTANEATLLADYRLCDEDGQTMLRGLARRFRTTAPGASEEER